MTKLIWTTAMATVLGGIMVSPVAAAQTAEPASNVPTDGAQSYQLQEIVVTARRRAESLQSTPVAVTVLNQEQLSKRGQFSVNDLVGSVPNLNVANQQGVRSDVVISLRGQSQVFGVRYPSVVSYFAEVPVLGLTKGQFYDLESVQVLRGPQGTLFGRVTDGGNIMLAPKKPTNDFEGYLEGSLGSHEFKRFSGAINVPIVEDKVLFRGAFDVNRRDGFTKNMVTGKNLDDVHYDSFRGSLILRPSEGLENYTIFDRSKSDENGFSLLLSVVNEAPLGPIGPLMTAALAAQEALGPRATNNGSLLYGPQGGNFSRRKSTILVNTTTWNPSDSLQIKNVFGHVRSRDRYGYDSDGSGVPLFDFPDLFLPRPALTYEQFSEEFQVQGKAFNDKLDYTIGTYWDSVRTPEPVELNAVIFGGQNYANAQYLTSKSAAVYGQIGYDLGGLVSGLKLDAGIRYTHDKSKSRSSVQLGLYDPAGSLGLGPIGFESVQHGVCDASVACTIGKTSSKAVTYTVGLNYQATDKVLLYGKLSRGYRPGGFNPIPLPLLAEYKPEYVLSLEAGVKADYDLGPVRARTNLAVFKDRYTDIQKIILVVDDNGVPASIITNSAAADIWGVELEQTFVPVTGLNIIARYAYVSAKFDRDPAIEATACSAPFLGFCTRNEFQATPKNTFSVDAHYTLPLDPGLGEISFGGNWYHRSNMFGGDNSFLLPGLAMPGYSLVNLDASWNRVLGSSFDLRFFMTNATNKLYQSGAQSLENTFGFAAKQYGEPRMWGFALRYNFGPR